VKTPGYRAGGTARDDFKAQRHAWRLKVCAEFKADAFSVLCRKDLLRLVGSPVTVKMLEVQCVVGNYSDKEDHADLTRAVARLLRDEGVKLPRGKRTRHPELVRMTEALSETLVDYGMPFATGERARMVTVLRRIAVELSLEGDPRDVLKQQARTDRKTKRLANEAIIRAVLRGLAPLAKVNGLPE
jgi:hypothetical protein